MPDTIDERLARLGGSLEAAAEIRSPSLVRSRGEQIRVAHRRRVVAVTATTAAVGIIGVGSLVAFRPAGGHDGAAVDPGATGSSTTSSPATTPPPPLLSLSPLPPSSSPATSTSSATTPPASAKPIVVIDLTQDTMKVYDKQGQLVKTVLVSGGASRYPSRTGIFTVTAKNENMVGTSPGDFIYKLSVHWVVLLDEGAPRLFAAPWLTASLGNANKTHGDICMSDDDAQWLYNRLAVGDRIQIQ